jgi:hypothetical protein
VEFAHARNPLLLISLQLSEKLSPANHGHTTLHIRLDPKIEISATADRHNRPDQEEKIEMKEMKEDFQFSGVSPFYLYINYRCVVCSPRVSLAVYSIFMLDKDCFKAEVNKIYQNCAHLKPRKHDKQNEVWKKFRIFTFHDISLETNIVRTCSCDSLRTCSSLDVAHVIHPAVFRL